MSIIIFILALIFFLALAGAAIYMGVKEDQKKEEDRRNIRPR